MSYVANNKIYKIENVTKYELKNKREKDKKGGEKEGGRRGRRRENEKGIGNVALGVVCPWTCFAKQNVQHIQWTFSDFQPS